MTVYNGDPLQIGASLPILENVQWTVQGERNRLDIRFHFSGDECPPEICAGAFCLECIDHTGLCNVAVKMADPSLGMDSDPAKIGCSVIR